MYMARNWMFNYPCLSKHGDKTRRDETQSFNLKEILNGSWDFTQRRILLSVPKSYHCLINKEQESFV